MKTASVYEVQHNFSRVLDWVNAGETVIVRRRNLTVAKIVPMEKESTTVVPDFATRLEKIYKERIIPDSQCILDELRSDRV